MTPRTASVLTSVWTTVFTVPSPPAATKRRRPSPMQPRMAAAQSTSGLTRNTSSPASRAEPSSAAISAGGSFTPEEGLRSIKPLRPADMNRIFLVAVTALFCAFSLFAADAPKECNLCVGAVTDLKGTSATPVPLLAQIRQDDLDAAGAALDAMTPEARAKLAVIVGYSVDREKD